MESIFFIALIIVAITQLIKMASLNVQAWLTVIVALLLGLLIAVIDTFIEMPDLSITQGLMAGLGSIGLSSLASKAGGGARGDINHPVR